MIITEGDPLSQQEKLVTSAALKQAEYVALVTTQAPYTGEAERVGLYYQEYPQVPLEWLRAPEETYLVRTKAKPWVPLAQIQKQLPEGAIFTGVVKTPETLLYTYIPKDYEKEYLELLKPPKPTPTWKETTITGKIYTGEISAFLLGPVVQLPWLYQKGMETLFPSKKEEIRQQLKPFVSPFQEFGAGATGVFEVWVRPEVPTPIGAVVGKVLARPQQWEAYATGEVSPFYLAGGILGTYSEAKATGWALGKAWSGVKRLTPELIKRPLYEAKEVVRFSQTARLIQKAGLELKYAEPFYTLRKIPSEVSTWMVKRGSIGAIEREIGWGEAKFLIPKGFEFWATIHEAPKHVGYPILFGTISKYGIVSVTKPSAFTQIQHAIERGMFPRMGGLSATQVQLFEKPTREIGKGLVFRGLELGARTTGKTFIPTLVGLGVATIPSIVQRPTPKITPSQILIQEPKLKPFTWELEKQKFPEPTWELEKQRFRFMEPTISKPKERGVTLPRIAPLPKAKPFQEPIIKPFEITIQTQKEIPITIPKSFQKEMQIPAIPIPTPTMPKVTYPPSWLQRGGGFGEGGRQQALFGKWFKRVHPIKTPEEMLRTFGFKQKKGRLRFP